MLLIRKFTKEEVLRIIAEHASRSLPPETDGMLESRETEDGIEVYFIKSEPKLTN